MSEEKGKRGNSKRATGRKPEQPVDHVPDGKKWSVRLYIDSHDKAVAYRACAKLMEERGKDVSLASMAHEIFLEGIYRIAGEKREE